MPRFSGGGRASALGCAALLTLLCSGPWHGPDWLGRRGPPLGVARHPAAGRRGGALHRAAAPPDGAPEAPLPGPDEPDPLLDEARAAAEAAKLRLEAAKLRQEAELWRARSGGEAPPAAAAPVPMSAPVSASPGAAVAPTSTGAGSEAQADASALVGSPAVRRACGVLLRLQRADGGRALEDLVLRACSELEAGGGSADAVVGDGGVWEGAGVDPAEAREALAALAELLALRGSPVTELKTTRQRDRAAVLKVVIYDQLPETSRAYAKMAGMEQEGSEDGATELTVMDAQLQISEEERKAVRFLRRLELFPSEADRDQERLRRLREMPLAKEALAQAGADPELAELGAAVAPLETRLYGAVRGAQLRARPKEETDEDRVQVVSLEFNLAQALGALVVIIVLAYGSAQLAKGAFQQRSGYSPDQMPTYGLQSRGGGPGPTGTRPPPL
uniref:Uncharacterized protein n=1 Tax=Alexandrium monilatum TaxID=311494 RepID=A0A7S4UG38_9DINO